MSGLFRIELRRSLALGVAAVIALLGTVMYYAGANLGGGWIGAALQQRAMLGVLWAFALAGGAAQARRDRRRRMEELISTTAAPRWRRVLPTSAALALGAAVGYLAMFLGSAAHLLPGTTYFAAGSLPVVAVGALSVIAAVCLGLGIGARIPWPLTPPSLALAGVVLLFVIPSYLLGIRHGAEPEGLLLLSPVLQPTNGLVTELITVTGRTHLLQATWFAALAVSGLVLFAAVGRKQMTAILPVLLGAALVVPLLPHQAADAFTPDQAAAALVCDATGPRVCVTKVHAAALADLKDPARQALQLLAAKLSNPPTSVIEEVRPQHLNQPEPQSADTVVIGLQVTASGRLAKPSDTLLWQLLSGAGTRPCDTGSMPPDLRSHYFTARLVAAAWVRGQPPTNAPDEPSRQLADLTLAAQAFEHLQTQPAEQQQAKIATMRQAEIVCSAGDRLRQLR